MDVTAVQGPGPAPAPTPVDAERAAENRTIITAIKAINASELSGSNSEITFVIEPSTKRPILRLVDKKTRDVIRQIPPEYMLRMAEEIAKREKRS